MGAQFRSQHAKTQTRKERPRDDVAHVRKVMKNDRLRRQDRRGHARQRRVLRAADRDASFDWVAAANAKFVHENRLMEN